MDFCDYFMYMHVYKYMQTSVVSIHVLQLPPQLLILAVFMAV